MLAEAWPSIRDKCRSPLVLQSIGNIARSHSASDDDVKSAALWIVTNTSTVNNGTGLPQLFAKAFENIQIETPRQQENYSCDEPTCYRGYLLLKLSDNSETTVACPYCLAGQQKQLLNNRPKHDKCLDEGYYRTKAALVKAALTDYEHARQRRIRRKEGFKYE